MNKLPVILMLTLFGSMLFASCKKDYTCACQVGIPFVFDTVINVEIKDVKKKQAKIACENNDNTIETVSSAFIASMLQGFDDSSMGGGIVIPANLVSATCELK